MAAKWRLVREAIRQEAPMGAQNDVEGDIVLGLNAESGAVAPVSRVAVMRERFLVELQRARTVIMLSNVSWRFADISDPFYAVTSHWEY